jgi:hypothetical protein
VADEREAISVLGLGESAAPIMASSIVWFKMHPLLGVSHGLGWLARFVVTGLNCHPGLLR